MNKIYSIIIGVLAFIIFIMGVDGCNNRNEIESVNIKLSEKENLITTYRSNEGWLMETNTVSEALRVEQVQGLVKLLDSLDARKPSVVIKYKSIFRVDTLNFAFADTLPCAEFNRDFEIDSNYISIEGNVSTKGIVFSKVEIPNDMAIVIAQRESKWYKFKRDSVSVIIRNNNAHIKGKQLEAYTFAPAQRFYNKVWFKAALFGVGLVTGAAIIK